jgi:hypothetical protein
MFTYTQKDYKLVIQTNHDFFSFQAATTAK